MDKTTETAGKHRAALLLALGAGLGGAVGMVLGQSTMGVAIGVGLGAVAAPVLNWLKPLGEPASGDMRR